MWCPRCGSEYREGITRCEACGVDLVAEPTDDYSYETGPLTGQPIGEEIETVGPALVSTFFTMEEAQAALRALGDAGIAGEIVPRDEAFPTTISSVEPPMGLSVPPQDLPKARAVLRSVGLLPTAVARFQRQEDAAAAVAALEAAGLKPRISALVLDEVPPEFRADMDPFIVEIPSDQEAAAIEILRGSIFRSCESCGAQIQPGDTTCRACGEPVTA